MAERQRQNKDVSMLYEEEDEEMEGEEEDEEFYTPGGASLLKIRHNIARLSLDRAEKRLKDQNLEAEVDLTTHVTMRRKVIEKLKSFAAAGSQSGFERPVSATRYSSDSSKVAVGDWSGSIRLLDSKTLDSVKTYHEGHTGNVSGLCWFPGEAGAEKFVSGGLEGHVKLWTTASDKPLQNYLGHEGRVARVDIHPTGTYIASASYDYTWRLWDVESGSQLLEQEGHSKEVFAVRFQCDGSLIASGGLDAIGRVWDLRTGRTALILDGHVREIYSIDWSPNGYQIVTGSADNSVMVWDLRQMKSIFTIPAHNSIVSDVRFFSGDIRDSESSLPVAGTFLVTSSYDKTVKLWSADNWALQRTLQDSDKVMSVDIAPDFSGVISGRRDRNVSLWTPRGV
jgi:U4/U6 small nuclear ribonucleoprotein PRP4